MVRSLGHQLMPVKYFNVVPASITSASIFCSINKRCAFAMRAILSCKVMGTASMLIDCSSYGTKFL